MQMGEAYCLKHPDIFEQALKHDFDRHPAVAFF